jgi:competence protein ComGC
MTEEKQETDYILSSPTRTTLPQQSGSSSVLLLISFLLLLCIPNVVNMGVKTKDQQGSFETNHIFRHQQSIMSRLEHVRSRRYLSRGSYRKSKGRNKIIAEDLQEENNSDGEWPWLTAEDIKWKYRVYRESFWLIHDLIKDHDVFKQKGPRG